MTIGLRSVVSAWRWRSAGPDAWARGGPVVFSAAVVLAPVLDVVDRALVDAEGAVLGERLLVGVEIAAVEQMGG